VSDPVRPRFELEDGALPRLEEIAPEPGAPPAPAGAVSAGLLAAGAAVLVLGGAVLGAGDFVAAQFARAASLGWATLAVAAGGFGLLGAGILRELRGLLRLRGVDALRARLADPQTRRDAALEWLATLPEGATLMPAIRAANDPDAILALLRAGPAAELRARAQALGRAASLQVFTLTAAVPSPAFDGLAVMWRGARLIREVAALHGLRPGGLGTLALLRRTAFAAAQSGAANFAADAAVRAVVSHPLLAHVAGDMAGGAVAARRMLTLARAADAACSPLPD
jgi:putative membrane protein